MKEEIIEGNKLIAVFMGGNFQIIPKGGLNGYKEGTLLWFSLFSSHPDPVSFLEFDSSWDWIMPVVEKIESMDFGFKMCRKVVEVYIDSTKEVILKTKESRRIESLWLAVVQFIRWYNTTHQPADKQNN